MSNLYRGPTIDASYQVSYHLDKRFQRKSCFRNRPTRNKNCLWLPFLLTTWPPQTILVSDWMISKKSSPLKPLCQMNRNLVCRMYLWQVLYKDCSFHPLSVRLECLIVDTLGGICRCFPPNFGSLWQSSFREEDFQKSTNLKQELPVAAMLMDPLKNVVATGNSCF
jgi:hypothetical protein